MRQIVGVFALALALVALSNIPAFAVSATVSCTNTLAVGATAVDLESGQTAAAAGRHWLQVCNGGPNEVWVCLGPNGTTTTCTPVSGQGVPIPPNSCWGPVSAVVAPTYPGNVAPGGDIEAIQDAAAPTNSQSYVTVCDF
jgi:hypothetical protein